MWPANQYRTYLQTFTLTAPPGRVVLLLYERALRHLEAAKTGFALDDPAELNMTVNNNLQKAQEIIRELERGLDFDQGGELALTLSHLYDYFDERLQTSNLTKTPGGIDEVSGLVTELRNSWDQMLRSPHAA
ncbi:MAG TPA: flagellar export chaperone FliS [Verrucomicrobiae bacterium]|nr:flagellar export chaperone FliS [Verrucomicrobiae bacterium]